MEIIISFVVLQFGKIRAVEELGVSVEKNAKEICVLMDIESRLQCGKDSLTGLKTSRLQAEEQPEGDCHHEYDAGIC